MAHLFAFLAFGRREMGCPNSDTLSDKPRNSLVLTTGSETFLYLDPRAPCGAFSWNLRIRSCSVEPASLSTRARPALGYKGDLPVEPRRAPAGRLIPVGSRMTCTALTVASGIRKRAQIGGTLRGSN